MLPLLLHLTDQVKRELYHEQLGCSFQICGTVLGKTSKLKFKNMLQRAVVLTKIVYLLPNDHEKENNHNIISFSNFEVQKMIYYKLETFHFLRPAIVADG